jgi:hypothetical protein
VASNGRRPGSWTVRPSAAKPLGMEIDSWAFGAFFASMAAVYHWLFTVTRRSPADEVLVWDESDDFEPGYRPTLGHVGLRPNRRYHNLRAGGYGVTTTLVGFVFLTAWVNGEVEFGVLVVPVFPAVLTGWALWYRARTIRNEELVRIDAGAVTDNRDGRRIPIHLLERVVRDRYAVTADTIHFMTRAGDVKVDLRDVDLTPWSGDVGALMAAIRSVIPAPGSQRHPAAPADLTSGERVFPWRRVPIGVPVAGLMAASAGTVWGGIIGWMGMSVAILVAAVFGTIAASGLQRLVAPERLGVILAAGRLHVPRLAFRNPLVVEIADIADVTRVGRNISLHLRSGQRVSVGTGLLRDGDELVTLLQQATVEP